MIWPVEKAHLKGYLTRPMQVKPFRLIWNNNLRGLIACWSDPCQPAEMFAIIFRKACCYRTLILMQT
jgi:hypothetical protein